MPLPSDLLRTYRPATVDLRSAPTPDNPWLAWALHLAHTQIVTFRHNLALAEQPGLPYEAHLHRARLEDLMDMAARHGIDVSPWIDHPIRLREAMTD